MNLANLLSGEMLKIITKTYCSSIRLDISKSQQSPASLVPWCTLFIQIIEKNIPIQSMPADEDEREKYCWWKAKKWAYHCFYYFLSRYTRAMVSLIFNQKKGDKKYASFSKLFLGNFISGVLQAYLGQLNLAVSGTWMSQRSKQQ